MEAESYTWRTVSADDSCLQAVGGERGRGKEERGMIAGSDSLSGKVTGEKGETDRMVVRRGYCNTGTLFGALFWVLAGTAAAAIACGAAQLASVSGPLTLIGCRHLGVSVLAHVK